MSHLKNLDKDRFFAHFALNTILDNILPEWFFRLLNASLKTQQYWRK